MLQSGGGADSGIKHSLGVAAGDVHIVVIVVVVCIMSFGMCGSNYDNNWQQSWSSEIGVDCN